MSVSTPRRSPRAFSLPLTLAVALAGVVPAQTYTPDVRSASDEGANAIAGHRPASGLEVQLVAAEPHLANPVAFAVDARGRLFVVETFRLRAGVYDTRSHRYWRNEDLACQTLADRLAMMDKWMAKDDAKNRADHERIRLLVDDDGDHVVDRAWTYADGFNELGDGIAAGVLTEGEDVWFTCIPKLWRLRDTDGDDRADQRDALQDGYGVHFSLIGHDMHGLRVGPDRRLYFSIGDRGFHVVHDGDTLAYPHEGAVLRCELDGSDLEVYHRGLRNPQELAFDAWGNLFTGDNNSDGGDRARWVHIVDGGTSGWCIGFQWLSNRGAWHEDKLWHTEKPDRAVWVLPPLAHIGHGPSGLTVAPGTGLPERYRDCFFLCDFRGTPTRSGIHALRFQPDGATFQLVSKERVIWNVLPTDVEVGVDGGLYFTDWVTGWGKTGKGRIYRVFDPELEGDAAARDTAALLAADFASRDVDGLVDLLTHADQRVRQKAQFELVDRGDDAAPLLAELATAAAVDVRARLHAVWALGIRARTHGGGVADAALAAVLKALVDDPDARVRAQAAKVLGEDGPYAAARDALVARLEDDNAHVVFQAATALGRLGDPASAPALVALLERNDDRDAYLRHAAMFALTRLGDRDAIRKAATHASAAVRLGAALAMRELRMPALATMLTDASARIRDEAARAIHDVPVEPAWPALAARSEALANESIPFQRRVLNTRRDLGRDEDAVALAAVAARDGVPEAMRIEALDILAEWAEPDGQNRVFGNWRPAGPRQSADAHVRALTTALPELLGRARGKVATRAAEVAGALRVSSTTDALEAIVAASKRHGGPSRAAALEALRIMKAANLARAARHVTGDDPLDVRKIAVRVLADLDPPKAVPVLDSLVASSSTGEKQNALATLGRMGTPEAGSVLARWVDELVAGNVQPAIQLDLIEAANRRGDASLTAKIGAFDAKRRADAADPLAFYRETLKGGDRKAGRKIFRERVEMQCVRCHKLGGNGGEAGPALDGVGKRHDREYLLRSLINPQSDIAEGFGNVVVTKADGSAVAGFLKSRDDTDGIRLVDAENKAIHVPAAQVRSCTEPVSAMPPLALALSKRELRDLVEFLATLK